MLRRITATFLLAIYSVAIVGYTLSILLCHCPHSSHVAKYHKVCTCHSCSHASHDIDIVDVEAGTIAIAANNACCCSHKHTTDVELYDDSHNVITLPMPFEAHIPTSAIDIEDITRSSINCILAVRRSIPLPDSPDKVSCALRAPPVKA